MVAAPTSRSEADTFSPSIVSFFYFLVLMVIAYQVYYHNWFGIELSPLGSMVIGMLGVMKLNKSINDHFRKRGHHIKINKFKEGAADFGQSRKGEWEDIEACEYFSETEGNLIGTFTDKQGVTHDVRVAKDANISVESPPGSKKTHSLVVSPIFAGLGNFICHDPSGEVLSIVYWFLKKLKYKIYLISPFSDEIRETSDIQELRDAGIDIFCNVNIATTMQKKRVELEAALKRVINDKKTKDIKSKFFYRQAEKICLHLGLRMIHEGIPVTLPGIRGLLMLGMNYLSELYTEDAINEEMDESVAELSKTLGGVLAKSPQQYSGGYEIAMQAFEIFSPASTFGEHVSQASFDPAILKDSNEKVAVFVSYPMQYMDSHGDQLSTTFMHLIDMVAASKLTGSCTVLLDEAGVLDIPLAEKLNFYRKLGLRFVMIWQDVSGQAEKKHEKTGLKSILNASQIKIGMNLVEQESLKLFSDMAGKRSVVKRGLNDRANMAQSMPDMAPGLNHESVPLIRPEELRTLDPNKMLVIAQNCHPILLDKLPWWEREEWKREAGNNPFYRGDE